MKAILIFVIFGLCTCPFYGAQGCGGGGGYDTKYEESFQETCSSGESLVEIRSSYGSSRKFKDRIWGISCRDNPFIKSSCRWSHPDHDDQYVNNHCGTVNFTCPGEGYMVGMYAEALNSNYGDRRFDFKCCDAKPGKGQAKCTWTSYVNDWQGSMNYEALSGYYIAGAYSIHSKIKKDRRWSFYICK